MKSNDPDREYLFGCSIAGLAALLVIAFPITRCLIDAFGPKVIYTTSGLSALFMQSAAGAIVVSLFFCILWDTPAFTGSFGGWICGGVYWFLHLQQSIAKAVADRGEPTEYLDQSMWWVPIGWIVLGAIVCGIGHAIFLKRQSRRKMSAEGSVAD